MKLLSFPFAIIALSTVALSVGCGKSDDTGGDDTGTQTTDTGTPIVDADSDGVAFDDDCDDTDATLGAVAEDADCDGSLTADDCDDTDASLNHDDVDIDGYSTCDGDCDDTDDTVLLCPITHPGGGDMILIPAGTFDMGCTAAQQADGNCESEESPVHSVTLTHDFYMGETEVTQGEYQSIMGSNPSYFSSCGSTCPVEYITWHQMAEYANALSVLDGLTECFSCLDGECSTPNSPYTCDGYRLPTEAEWEYAARAGTDYVYSGSSTVGDVAWYHSNASSQPHPVAQKLPNDWGLYDMTGNVYEWVWDWYDSSYYSSSPSSDPEGPTSASSRVVRGGSWKIGASDARVAGRYGNTPSYRDSSLGFRLSRTANP
jgi:sulfatase modifying factor 1